MKSLFFLIYSSGISLSTIKQANNIQNASYIQKGQIIKIPYTIYESDIKYYSQSITITAEQLQKTNALEEIANLYGTDIETLYNGHVEIDTWLLSDNNINTDNKIIINKYQNRLEAERLVGEMHPGSYYLYCVL